MKAIITGHSRGLGAAIAEELLARQIPVLALSRNRNETLAERFPSSLQQEAIDLSDQSALAHWLATDSLRSFLAGSDTAFLINNAGTVQPVGSLAMQSPEAVARAITLNVVAPLMMASAVVTATPQARDRRILHISSGAGRNAYSGWNVYCATKAALDHHARSVVLDAVPGVRICSLAPGVIDTDMQAEIRATTLQQFPLRERFEALKREGSLADPHACAQRLVDYLLADGFGQAPVADLRDVA